jgi:hypothetical protein
MENMRLNFVPVPEFGTGTYSFSEIDRNLSQKKEGPRIWILELVPVSNSGIRAIWDTNSGIRGILQEEIWIGEKENHFGIQLLYPGKSTGPIFWEFWDPEQTDREKA